MDAPEILSKLPKTPNNQAWVRCILIATKTSSKCEKEYIKDMGVYYRISLDIVNEVCDLFYPPEPIS